MNINYLSLREISRRLDIPASSITYYKDRFSRHIPRHPSGTARRTRYPFEALSLFKEIRTMFEQNWTAEQIEQELQNKLGQSGDDKSYEQLINNNSTNIASDPLLKHLNNLLERTASLLENQALFRAEIDSLRLELDTLRQEKRQVEQHYLQKIAALENDLDELRQEKAEMLRAILEQSARPGPDSDQVSPPEVLLSLPLVLKTSADHYLGVGGKGQVFSLRKFLELIENNDQGNKTVRLSWSKDGPRWLLEISILNKDSLERHQHAMELRQTITPNHNNVIELSQMVSDGNTVPQEILLALFRKIKEELKG